MGPHFNNCNQYKGYRLMSQTEIFYLEKKAKTSVPTLPRAAAGGTGRDDFDSNVMW